MAYALSIKSKLDFKEEGDIMLIITLLYALTTILIIPLFYTNRILQGLKTSARGGDREVDEAVHRDRRQNCCDRLKAYIQNIDDTYLKNLFILYFKRTGTFHLGRKKTMGHSLIRTTKGGDRASESL